MRMKNMILNKKVCRSTADRLLSVYLRRSHDMQPCIMNNGRSDGGEYRRNAQLQGMFQISPLPLTIKRKHGRHSIIKSGQYSNKTAVEYFIQCCSNPSAQQAKLVQYEAAVKQHNSTSQQGISTDLSSLYITQNKSRGSRSFRICCVFLHPQGSNNNHVRDDQPKL